MNAVAVDCDTIVPSNGSLNNYTKVGNCSCAACDRACPPPPVNATIGFFDGFNVLLVVIVYLSLAVFSIIYQVIRRKFFNKLDASGYVGSQNSEEALTNELNGVE